MCRTGGSAKTPHSALRAVCRSRARARTASACSSLLPALPVRLPHAWQTPVETRHDGCHPGVTQGRSCEEPGSSRVVRAARSNAWLARAASAASADDDGRVLLFEKLLDDYVADIARGCVEFDSRDGFSSKRLADRDPNFASRARLVPRSRPRFAGTTSGRVGSAMTSVSS